LAKQTTQQQGQKIKLKKYKCHAPYECQPPSSQRGVRRKNKGTFTEKNIKGFQKLRIFVIFFLTKSHLYCGAKKNFKVRFCISYKEILSFNIITTSRETRQTNDFKFVKLESFHQETKNNDR